MRSSPNHLASVLLFFAFFLLCLHAKAGGPSPYEKWLDEDVRWIITPQQRAEFVKLTTDAQRDKFIESFWEHRDPTPGTAKNEFKEEHYRRLAYANEHFAAQKPGWKTDRGRIYIVYGPPDKIETHAAQSDKEKSVASGHAFQVWRYRYLEGVGQNVTANFVDTCDCGEYRLQAFGEKPWP